MRPDAADQNVVAVDVQVLWRDRSRNIGARALDEAYRLHRGNVLEDHAQRRQPVDQRLQDPIDEHRFAVENVDVGCGHFAMDAQRHANFGHPFENAHDVRNIGHAMRRIGRRARGIELGRGQHAVGMPHREIVGIALVCQISGHQRCEGDALGYGSPDAIAIGCRQRGSGDRRGEIGHDDGTRELARGLRHHRAHRLTIAEMQMPVVGAADCQRFDHAVAYGREWPICHA